MPIEFIKIIGERNSGTNYIEKIINGNFYVNLLPGSMPWLLNKTLGFEFVRDYYFKKTQHKNLGWKHAMAPTNSFLENIGMKDEVGFVAIAKNPYAWLISMFRRPYHLQAERQSFDQFIRSQCRTVSRERYAGPFKNPMTMWNKKNKSYVDLCDYGSGLIIPYESFLYSPEYWMAVIEKKFLLDRKSSAWVNVNNDVKGGAESLNFYKDYYLNCKWVKALNLEQIYKINQSLDEGVMHEYGYQKI